MTSARSEPSPSRTDTRFATIDDAVALLKLLPPVERIAWPLEPGDEQTVADALDWLAAWTPPARAAFRRQRRARRVAGQNGKVH
jgi:hypothetical protein